MASQQVTTNFPYYHLSVNGTAGILNEVLLTFQATDGGIPGGLSADQIADAFRDWVAGLSNHGSSTLEQVEVARTAI